MFSIKDKIIVVTGGNGLLGRNIVNSLNREGAIAICADISNDMNNESIFLDITKEESISDCIKNLIIRYGKIDGWINNAYPRTSDWGNKFEDIKYESWRTNIDKHLNGYFLCSKYILEQMKNQGFGSLINMSSIYGLIGPDFSIYNGTEMTMPAAYSAIKGGITNLTRYLASYYGKYNVRINTISPGGIFDNQPSEFVEKYCNKVPLNRMGNPSDIVGAIHFLMSIESSYITGQNFVIDGGFTII